MTTIDIAVGDSAVSAYIAMPEGDGPWPSVCVIHDALGMSNDVRRQADWLASEGYLVAAPDLFDGRTLFGCLRRVILDFTRNEGPLFDRIEGVRQWLKQHPQSTGKVGVIGFCFGGGFALVLAPSGGFDVASVNYGNLPRNPEIFLQQACPIVASYGAIDRNLKGAAAKLEGVLTAANIDHDVKEYPNTDHAFMNNHEDDTIPFLIQVISVVFGGGDYNEASAKDAQERITAFFDKHLNAPAG